MPEQKPETIEKPALSLGHPVSKAKMGTPLDTAINRTKDYLCSLQHPDGYWVAELESNTTMIAEYVFFMHFMAIWSPERVEKCKNTLSEDAFEGADHLRRVAVHPRHTEGHVGFHGSADIAGLPVIQGPSAVRLLGFQ